MHFFKFNFCSTIFAIYGVHRNILPACIVVVIVDFSFTMVLTPQVISITFYSEHVKSNKFCSEALILA